MAGFYTAQLPKPQTQWVLSNTPQIPETVSFTVDDDGTEKKAVGTPTLLGAVVIAQYAVPLLGADSGDTGGGGGGLRCIAY